MNEHGKCKDPNEGTAGCLIWSVLQNAGLERTGIERAIGVDPEWEQAIWELSSRQDRLGCSRSGRRKGDTKEQEIWIAKEEVARSWMGILKRDNEGMVKSRGISAKLGKYCKQLPQPASFWYQCVVLVESTEAFVKDAEKRHHVPKRSLKSAGGSSQFRRPPK
ncbi:hypothetical protein BFJ63_vAg18676 [Fusarium oxysporum f. sp. narcissi]|uniref:Uncharacterized protein n=1 Tax=Fusarium oxysporum f. sp. narcissi TaxID=451672 RepID=A0A4Q2UVV9_FUSOX|nr:hypothetical protein BFJ63_vAg18676 [Fusarium oxysporum f. sp. narcissi]